MPRGNVWGEDGSFGCFRLSAVFGGDVLPLAPRSSDHGGHASPLWQRERILPGGIASTIESGPRPLQHRRIRRCERGDGYTSHQDRPGGVRTGLPLPEWRPEALQGRNVRRDAGIGQRGLQRPLSPSALLPREIGTPPAVQSGGVRDRRRERVHVLRCPAKCPHGSRPNDVPG